jgi:hypothetical protein
MKSKEWKEALVDWKRCDRVVVMAVIPGGSNRKA